MTFAIISIATLLLASAVQTALFSGKTFPLFPKQRGKTGLFLYMISVAVVIGLHLSLIFTQYMEWKNAGPPTSFLIPPYRSIGYLFSYHFGRYFIYHLASFLASLGLLFFIKAANKKSGKRFFEDDEPYIASIPTLLLGYYAWNYLWIFHLLAVFVLGLVMSFLFGKVRRGEERISFYFFWIPLAIVGIIIAEFLL